MKIAEEIREYFEMGCMFLAAGLAILGIYACIFAFYVCVVAGCLAPFVFAVWLIKVMFEG